MLQNIGSGNYNIVHNDKNKWLIWLEFPCPRIEKPIRGPPGAYTQKLIWLLSNGKFAQWLSLGKEVLLL